MFTIKMTGYYVDPTTPPTIEMNPKKFATRDDAMTALTKLVDEEVADLNSGDADGEFVANYGGNEHDCVVEFWIGPPTENDRDFRIVTEYDIIAI